MDWSNTMSVMLAYQQDMHEVISRFKDMVAPVPMDVTFEFYDGYMYTVPNFAKMLELVSGGSGGGCNCPPYSETAAPSTLLLRTNEGAGQLSGLTVISADDPTKYVEVDPVGLKIRDTTNPDTDVTIDLYGIGTGTPSTTTAPLFHLGYGRVAGSGPDPDNLYASWGVQPQFVTGTCSSSSYSSLTWRLGIDGISVVRSTGDDVTLSWDDLVALKGLIS